jgi:CRP-like cAMP-binding protein
MRSSGGTRRLVITPSQSEILSEDFVGQTTVPEVLARLVYENRCPPLLEFYELVLQAHHAGILVTGLEAAESTLAVQWPAKLPTRLGLGLGYALSGVSAVALLASVTRWSGPSDWVDAAGGWIAACLLVSGGQMLAACVVARSAGEVRRERLQWRTVFPHFQTDTAEAIMGGRLCERAVAMLRVSPVLLGAAAVPWRFPGLLAPILAAVLYVLGPWEGSAATQWLSAQFGKTRFTVGMSHLFEPMRDDHWILWGTWWRGLKSRFGLLRLGWAVVWVGLLVAALTRFFPGATAILPRWFGAVGHGRNLLSAVAYFLASAAALAAAALLWAAFKHWRIRRDWRRPIRGADVRVPDRGELKGGVEDVLRQVTFFSDWDAQEISELASVIESVPVERGHWVFKENDPGDAFYLVQEGELEVLKTLPGRKRRTTIGWMGPGDCFGEIALLENTPRTASVKARRRTMLLKLGRNEFEGLVLHRVGASKLREVLQHMRYLGRLTFMAGWPASDLFEFARRCRTAQFNKGAFVLRRGEPNQYFYLIFDGWFEAREETRVLRRMGPGDYFGEISLLENWNATADVVALEEGRCVTMGRMDFLALFTRGFRIAIRMEAIAGQRLGSDVFISR